MTGLLCSGCLVIGGGPRGGPQGRILRQQKEIWGVMELFIIMIVVIAS